MSNQSPVSCPHDLGPGITVCLRCRSAEREAARARQQRVVVAGAVVVVVVGLLGSAAVGAARSPRATRPATTASETVTQQGETSASAAEPQAPAAAAPAPATGAPVKPAMATSPGLPSLAIPEGHSALSDGLSVDRKGDQAVVSFDTPEARTRRRDKVEQVIRATLPALYGSAASEALARIPDRTMSQGDLLTEVVPAGIRIPLATGAIALSLETRPGQDGPLVVRYRARVVPR